MLGLILHGPVDPWSPRLTLCHLRWSPGTSLGKQRPLIAYCQIRDSCLRVWMSLQFNVIYYLANSNTIRLVEVKSCWNNARSTYIVCLLGYMHRDCDFTHLSCYLKNIDEIMLKLMYVEFSCYSNITIIKVQNLIMLWIGQTMPVFEFASINQSTTKLISNRKLWTLQNWEYIVSDYFYSPDLL